MQEKVSKEKILAFLKELKPSLQKEGIKKIGLFGSYAKGVIHVYEKHYSWKIEWRAKYGL